MQSSNRAGLTGFLLSAFLIVGLTGLFAIYAIPIPFQRALNKQALLDEATQAANAPDAAVRLAALRSKLGDMADAVLGEPGTPQERIAQVRAATIAEMDAEVDQISLRLRWLVVIVTISAAGFGAALLGLSGKRTE